MESYSYAKVEAALARVFGANAAYQKGALRGRIIHLRRLGLPASGPGRGKTIAYTDAQVYAWLIALELEEFGINPVLAVRMIKDAWKNYLVKLIRTARDKDVILMVRPRFMSAAWGTDCDPILFSHFIVGEVMAVYDANGGFLRQETDLVSILAESGARVCAFNLSQRLRELDEALKEQEGAL
jgi:hypothetical protein